MEQTYFSKEQIEVLKKQEANLKRAHLSNWKSHTMKWENEEIANIYEKATGKHLTDWSCPSCCLKNYKIVGKMYLDSIEYHNRMDELNNKVVEIETLINEDKDVEPINEDKNIEPKTNAKKPSRKGTKQKRNA